MESKDNLLYNTEVSMFPFRGFLPMLPTVVKDLGRRLRNRAYRNVTPSGYDYDNAMSFITGNIHRRDGSFCVIAI